MFFVHRLFNKKRRPFCLSVLTEVWAIVLFRILSIIMPLLYGGASQKKTKRSLVNMHWGKRERSEGIRGMQSKRETYWLQRRPWGGPARPPGAPSPGHLAPPGPRRPGATAAGDHSPHSCFPPLSNPLTYPTSNAHWEPALIPWNTP